MALFQYKAFHTTGKKVSSTIEAGNLQEAKEKIRELGLLASQVVLCQKSSTKKMKQDHLIVFTGQLHQLLSAKIPLYESLLALEEQSRKESYHQVIAGISERIKTGKSLSQAMQEFPTSFPALYRGMIAAGEAVGNLEGSLSGLLFFLQRQSKVRKQVVSALIYPAMLACLMVLAIAVLVFFVIPSLEVLFEDRAVPTFTKTIFAISHFLRGFALEIVVGFFITCGALFFYYKKPQHKAALDRFFLRIPFISRYLILSSIARFSRTLGALLSGGVPIANAMSFAEGSLQSVRLREIMQKVASKMIEGVPLSVEMGRHKELPLLFVRMVRIGEESGTLPAMLAHVATLYEEEIERAISRGLALLQPILLLVMGTIVGTVLLSILLSISEFGSSLGA